MNPKNVSQRSKKKFKVKIKSRNPNLVFGVKTAKVNEQCEQKIRSVINP